jgi:hypothetical protein
MSPPCASRATDGSCHGATHACPSPGGPSSRSPRRAPERLARALRTKKRRLHAVPAHGCALLGGPRPRFVDVAPIRPERPVATVGPAFRACYVATYDIKGRYLQAALLVDAAGDGTVHVPGAMLARRAGNAWIVVRAGPPDVRRRLLDRLRARLP